MPIDGPGILLPRTGSFEVAARHRPMLTGLMLPLVAAGGSTLLAILGIGFLIFVHEWGHYMACRLTGTRVETFSIGFGTRLFGWERQPGSPRRFTLGRRRLDPAEHAMDFRVALIPLGGYVKMAGENPGEGSAGAADEFPNKPMLSRIFIVSAGVIMNLITAFVFYVIAFAGGVEVPPATVGSVVAGGPAWEAGIESGDRIVGIGDAPIRSFVDLRTETVFQDADEPVDVRIVSGGEERVVQVTPRYDDEAGIVALKILPSSRLEITSGGRTLSIGGEVGARIHGVEATGGYEAFRMVMAAAAGGEDFEISVDGEPSMTISVRTSTPQDGAQKIGVASIRANEVVAVRGTAKERDVPVGARLIGIGNRGEIFPVAGPGDLEWFLFRPEPVEFVFETPESGSVTVGLPTAPADRRKFLDGLGLHWHEAKNTLAPLPVGMVVPVEGSTHLARYPSSPAGDAGLLTGDEIVALGGEAVDGIEEIKAQTAKLPRGVPSSMKVERTSGVIDTLTLTPIALEVFDGFEVRLVRELAPFDAGGFGGVLSAAVHRTGNEVRNVFRLIGALFTGGISFNKNIAGPVTIVTTSADVAESSWLRFLTFLAYISVTLAVLNILPIPVLDGGHLLFILIEKIKGSPLKEETMGKMQLVGMALLLLLMFFAFRNDLRNLLAP